jgi:hypothetical protein
LKEKVVARNSELKDEEQASVEESRTPLTLTPERHAALFVLHPVQTVFYELPLGAFFPKKRREQGAKRNVTGRGESGVQIAFMKKIKVVKSLMGKWQKK